MSLANLQGSRCTYARANIPAFGVWWADATLDTEVTLSGRVTLQIADLALSGTVVSGGPSKGASHYRIAGGAGAWNTPVKAAGYSNDAGVKLATVLGEAATLAGETLEVSTVPATRVGTSFVRPAGPASSVLQLLAPEAWYVGEDGTTRLGARAKTQLTAAAPRVVPVDLARGVVTLAPTSIASILPGIQVDGLDGVDVQHELDSSGIRSIVWGRGTAPGSRRVSAWKRLFDQIDPSSKFRGVKEYRVVTQDGERLNLQPVRVSSGMPDLRRVVVRPGSPGLRADAHLGCRVLVVFVEDSPALPQVIAWEEAGGGGFVPTELDLCDAGGRVIRDGEVVSVTGPTSLATGVALGIIAIHPSMTVPGPPGTGFSRVKA